MKPFARLMTLLIAVTGLRICEVLALKWRHVDWSKFRVHVVSNFVRGKFGEPKSAASKQPVVLHPPVMGLLKNWRETTAYAGDEDFVFSDRLKGKQPRVPNMLMEDHLRPASQQVIEIPHGHRFGFHNLRHALTSFLVEIGTDTKTIQDMLRWADPFNPAQGLRALANGQAQGGSGKDDRRHGSERGNCSTVHPIGVGDRPWVIFSDSSRQIPLSSLE
jgi:integrase